jgi:hypothetical protein
MWGPTACTGELDESQLRPRDDRGPVSQTGSPFSSEPVVVRSLRTFCQVCAACALALLEADEFVYLLRTVDAFAESDPQHLHILRLEWCHRNLFRLSTVSYLRKRTVPLSSELPPWRRNVVASDG